jgi:hypothetical protein
LRKWGPGAFGSGGLCGGHGRLVGTSYAIACYVGEPVSLYE